MTSHYTWGSVTTVHDLEGVLGRPLHTLFWALTLSWSPVIGEIFVHNRLRPQLSREVTSRTKLRQIRSKWTPSGVHMCLDE